MTLPVGSIIKKLDTETQITGAIKPREAVSYIDSYHYRCLRSMRYVGSFVITIFGVEVY